MDGGLIYNGTGCVLDPEIMDFHDGYDDFSQILVTEDAATCWVNQIARSAIGHVHLDREKVNAFFDTEGMYFTTTTVKSAFPHLEDRYGADKAVAMDISASNATVQFGRFDADVTIDFKLHLSIDQVGQTVFQDEFDTILSADMIVDNDVVYFKILDLKLAPLPSSKNAA